MTEKPIQLGYAGAMSSARQGTPLLALAVILFLTVTTSFFAVLMVLSVLTAHYDAASVCGVYGAAVALLAALWSRGKSLELVKTNLLMFGMLLVGVAGAEWAR